MKKFVKIIELNQKIIDTQKSVVEKLKNIFPEAQVEAVGSIAVPMTGRPEIDIMVIVNKKDIASIVDSLISCGYGRGPVVDNIAYVRKFEKDIEIGIQVLPLEHKMIGIHKKILAKLQSDKKLRNSYSKLKKDLDGLPEENYKRQKSEWIRKNILSKKETFYGTNDGTDVWAEDII